ncbi:MAG: winged helix-turn-helix domain-containing protein [Chloroflexota bacterium]|nr:winged helix-turn-helix domain-containing protein [Chloroflexota bacterium]
MTPQHKNPVVSIEEEAYQLSQSQIPYKAYFFGPFRITLDEQALGEPAWRRNKAKALLKWFLLNPGDLFSVEQLCNLLWPDIIRKVAVSNLHVTMHYLRRILEPKLASGCPSIFIRRNQHNYYWFELNDVWWTDVFDIQHLSTVAREAERKGDLSRTIAFYDQLMAYYKQGFLPEDIYDDAFLPYRRQHNYAYAQSLSHLMQLYIHINQYDDALSCALHLLSLDAYNESAVKVMVQIHLRQGNTTGAIRHIDDYRRTLKQDLGIEPGEEILDLRIEILKTR